MVEVEKEIVIKYNVVTGELTVNADGLTTFEAMGLLEGAKAIIQHDWFEGRD
jgi:hypothetical protein